MHPKQWLPMKFDQSRFALIVDEAEGMDAKSIHHPVTPGNRPVRHDPHDHMSGFRCEGDEIPKGIMRRRRLRDFIIRFRFERMDKIGKLDRILDEKYRSEERRVG